MSAKEAPSPVEVSEDQETGQGRSTIKFPYQDLDDAVAVAKGVHAVGGTSCQREQLAAHLDLAATGGGFNLRLITAKVFGLITTEKGTVTLTPLGTRLCDSQQEKAARVEAFLAVPLYKAIYEQFKGTSLPPNPGLEGAMETLGVAPKQKDKARQVFQRSANQSGFFAYGNNRLVLPSIKGSAVTEAQEEGTGGGKSEDEEDEKPAEKLHPFIKGLLDKLPAAETEWPIEARKKWLQTAANIFGLMYSATDDDAGELTIAVEKDSAK